MARMARLANWKSCPRIPLIKRHSRTGRPLGNSEFISKLEIITGQALTPGRPGPGPQIGKLSILGEPQALHLTIQIHGGDHICY